MQFGLTQSCRLEKETTNPSSEKIYGTEVRDIDATYTNVVLLRLPVRAKKEAYSSPLIKLKSWPILIANTDQGSSVANKSTYLGPFFQFEEKTLEIVIV